MRLSRGVAGRQEGPLARKMRVTGDLPHHERFKLLLGLLVENRSDEEIHEVYRHAWNYDQAKTQGFIDHARANYQGHLRKRSGEGESFGDSSAIATPEPRDAGGRGHYLPGGVHSGADALYDIREGSERRALFDVFCALLRMDPDAASEPRYAVNCLALLLTNDVIPPKPYEPIPERPPKIRRVDPWLEMAYEMGLAQPPSGPPMSAPEAVR